MDIERLLKIELHGESTLLVTTASGFDSDTGQPLPSKEQGFQPDDLKAMRKAADDAVIAATDALTKAEARLAAFDLVLVHPVVVEAEANIAAKLAAAKAAKEKP